MLVALQVLIEKTIEMDGQAFVVFIDYSMAFDSISQVQMFEILTEMGFPKHLVALLEALYNDQSAVIRWNGRHSSAIKIERGVRQGCILSPHLFNLYTESVIREAGIEEMGIKIGGKFVPIWKDRGITKDLEMKLVRSLVWTVLTYGAEGWTLTKADEKRIQSAELWIYRRMLRVSWTEHRTDDSILTELGTTRQLLGFVLRRKLSFFGRTIRDGGCELVKCVIQGKVSGKRRRGRPKTSYSSIITKWTSVSTERITRETRDRAGWRKIDTRCGTGG